MTRTWAEQSDHGASMLVDGLPTYDTWLSLALIYIECRSRKWRRRYATETDHRPSLFGGHSGSGRNVATARSGL